MDIKKLDFKEVLNRIIDHSASNVYALTKEKSVIKNGFIVWHGRLYAHNVGSCKMEKLFEYANNDNVIFVEITGVEDHIISGGQDET